MDRPTASVDVTPIEIVIRGPVAASNRERFRSELAALVARAPRHAVFVRGELTIDANPSIARPARARATIVLDGRRVHSHVAAAAPAEAIDRLVERLRGRLRDLHDRQVTYRSNVPHDDRAGAMHWRQSNRRLPRGKPALPTGVATMIDALLPQTIWSWQPAHPSPKETAILRIRVNR